MQDKNSDSKTPERSILDMFTAGLSSLDAAGIAAVARSIRGFFLQVGLSPQASIGATVDFLIGRGLSVETSFDAVLGVGTFASLAGEVHDAASKGGA